MKRWTAEEIERTCGPLGHSPEATIIRDLLAERDALATRLDTMTRARDIFYERVRQLSQTKPNEVTWRLPDKVGGAVVTTWAALPDSLDEIEAWIGEPGDEGTVKLRIRRDKLVEVRPPSIDDPVTLPLSIDAIAADGNDVDREANICIERPTWNKAVEAGAVAYIGILDCAYLTAEQARDAARALWKLGTAPSTEAGA